MTNQPERKRPAALTCPTCGGAVAQTTDGGLPRFTCHLGHRVAAAAMDEAQCRQTERVLDTALRMFNEWAELARRLAAAQRKRGRPVSADAWEATIREMDEAAEVLCRLLERGWRRPGSEGEDGEEPDAA
jgi:two-component system, chemotaxis family, protein-glutamate methylesterase/glutaminase